ncbi:interferon-induced protein 44-like [Saccostrea cucullata]|uniref:interferon-induced protein 44-like n=1 Tax=Saccostrea cuccullata TaxID=36930 RepID=UPI002ED04DBE
MGNNPSAADILEKEPWRKMPLTTTKIPDMRRELMGKIKTFQKKGNVNFLNILLLGQSSSGKSSFVNSCATALYDANRIVTPCGVLEPQSESVTARLEAHPIKISSTAFLPVRIFDCRGLHDLNGVHSDDIKNMCDGRIKNEYTFDPTLPVRSDNEKFRERPQLQDRMHCVVYVAAADNPKELLADGRANEQLKAIRAVLSAANIPQLVLLNKIDRLGMKDITTIFRNKLVKETCEGAMEFMSLPLGNVLPMINYTEEQTPDSMKDFLALFNLWYMMSKANDYVGLQSDVPEGFND